MAKKAAKKAIAKGTAKKTTTAKPAVKKAAAKPAAKAPAKKVVKKADAKPAKKAVAKAAPKPAPKAPAKKVTKAPAKVAAPAKKPIAKPAPVAKVEKPAKTSAKPVKAAKVEKTVEPVEEKRSHLSLVTEETAAPKKEKKVKFDRTGMTEDQIKWHEMHEKYKGVKAPNYSISGQFEAKSPIQHKIFGWGFILSNEYDRLEVLFEDSKRMLISNRKLS